MKRTSYWVIGVLVVLLLFSLYRVREQDAALASYDSYTEAYIDSLNTYRKTYPSSDFALLKRENKALYDELEEERGNVTEVVRYRWRTQYVDSGKVREVIPADTTFRFDRTSDTVSYRLEIVAPSLSSYKLDYRLSNEFTLVKREDGKDGNRLDITSGMEGSIDDVTAWSKKRKPSRFGVGISAGAGYGIINRKPDIFVGFTINYSLWKN